MNARVQHRLLSLMVAIGLLTGAASAQTIVVQVLNGRNGKPVKAGTVVQVAFPDEAVHRLLGLHTNRQGEVEFDAEAAKTFQVGVVGHASCREGAASSPPDKYAVEEISQSGGVGPNHCGQAIADPQAGRLILFVKSEGGWER